MMRLPTLVMLFLPFLWSCAPSSTSIGQVSGFDHVLDGQRLPIFIESGTDMPHLLIHHRYFKTDEEYDVSIDGGKIKKQVKESLQVYGTPANGECYYEYDVLALRYEVQGATIFSELVVVSGEVEVKLNCKALDSKMVVSTRAHSGKTPIRNFHASEVREVVPVAIANAVLKAYCEAANSCLAR